jgi:hypothetical protein
MYANRVLGTEKSGGKRAFFRFEGPHKDDYVKLDTLFLQVHAAALAGHRFSFHLAQSFTASVESPYHESSFMHASCSLQA